MATQALSLSQHADDHIDPLVLYSYVFNYGGLSPLIVQQVSAHIASCPHCQQCVRELNERVDPLNRDPSFATKPDTSK